MSKSLSGGFPGGAPSKAIHLPSGDSVGRFAFCDVWKILWRLEPSGRMAQSDGHGESVQKKIDSLRPPA